jgi:hypothetical protein
LVYYARIVEKLCGFFIFKGVFMISKNFKIAVKLADIPAWKIAIQAGINPNVLSKIMSGALRVKKGDQRVLKVAQVLELDPKDCFEMENRIENN